MRIINVVTRLNIGGASPPIISNAAGFHRYGHDSLLVVGTPSIAEGSMNADAERAGAQLLELPELQRDPDPIKDAKALAALVRLFRQRRPDVVGTHMSKAGALGRVAARLAGVKVVVHTYHAKAFYVFEQRWKEQATILSERALTRLGSGSIVVSEKQRRDFVDLRIDSADRLRVVRYGLQLEQYLDAPNLPRTLREEVGLPASCRLAGVIGRLVNMKGQDVFIRAAVDLARRFDDLFFVLVGDGDNRRDYEALVERLGLKDRVRFLGWRRDVPNILANLDVVVLPTVNDFEGTPLAVIEALAANKPVVATDVGGVSEVIRDNETGRLIPIRDPAAIVAAVGALLEHPQSAQAMSQSGRDLVSRLYREADMIAATEAYYRELAGTRMTA
ncbi:MAG: glycosyltransferase family 4 protein [Vicinamibacterales bacterium]